MFCLFFPFNMKLSGWEGEGRGGREEENENTFMCQGALKITFLSQSPDKKFLMLSPHSIEVHGHLFVELQF